VVQKAE
jgi:hypothetical protein